MERTWQWKEEYAGTIEGQLKKLGVSCDWDRERFTMDEGCSKAVEEVFIKLYEKGYIYKGIPDHQLVSGLQDVPVRRGSRARGTGRTFLAYQISDRRNRPFP